MSEDIPKQEEGAEMDVYSHVTLDDETAAKTFYQTAKMRLLEIYDWDKLSGAASATFTLVDPRGKVVQRAAMEGDYIQINIPGPGIKAGSGYDWVIIEQIHEESSAGNQMITMRARPSANPLTAEEDTAHFYKDKATSTFRVIRLGKEVHAEVHGRNEVANSDTEILIDNIRNVLVGWSAKLGFSYPQWKSLVNAIVRHD